MTHRAGRILPLAALVVALPTLASSGGAAFAAIPIGGPAPQTPGATSAGLRILVVAGEDAVNIIQQKTAVVPVVEVRDRNDQPIAGAIVRFAIEGGRATFGSARTLTVATNVAGRAAATGFTPTASGAVQISASAAFQGQTAVVAIAQTNVLTAAEAAAVSAGGASGGSGAAAGAGAAGGGGGGLSGTALGIIGGAAAGGALVAAKAAGGGSESSGSANPPPPRSTTYSGPVAAQLIITSVDRQPQRTITCTSTRDLVGVLTLTLEQRGDGTITGTLNSSGTQTETAIAGPAEFCHLGFGSVPIGWAGPVTGTPGNLGFSRVDSFTGSAPLFLTGTNSESFAGALSNGVISGTMTVAQDYTGQSSAPGGATTGGGTTTFPVTLR